MSSLSRRRRQSPQRQRSRRIIVDLAKKDISDNFLHQWLSRYGPIEDIQRFRNGIVVKFKLPIHAYDAVKTESRWRGPLEARLRLADSTSLAGLGSVVGGSQNSKSPTATDSSSTSSGFGSSKPTAVVRVDSQKPESIKPSSSTPHSTSSFELVKCEVYLLALGANMTHYSESVGKMLQQRAAQMVNWPLFRPPSMKTMVLTHEDHLGPCFIELSLVGVLYCLVFSPENYSSQTCTLRILQGPKHIEHRNMATSAAVEMLLSHFARHFSQQAGHPDTTVPDPLTPPLPPKLSATESLEDTPRSFARRPPSRHEKKRLRKDSISSSFGSFSDSVSGSCSGSISPPLSEFDRRHRYGRRTSKESRRRRRGSRPPPPPDDDPTFEAPSHRMASYLHMLADSRVLSVAELDQVLAFVKRRRDLMSGEALVDAPNSRIVALVNFNLVPKMAAISPATSSMPGVNNPGFCATNMPVKRGILRWFNIAATGLADPCPRLTV